MFANSPRNIVGWQLGKTDAHAQQPNGPTDR
jgi:hypothetical protein